MSYCRWSSDNFDCDLYCYHDVTGSFVTHVASNRVLGDIPKTLLLDPKNPSQWNDWLKANKEQSDFLETAEHAPIGLPYDGHSFYDSTLSKMLDRVLSLKSMGYHVPDFAIRSMKEDLKDDDMVELHV